MSNLEAVVDTGDIATVVIGGVLLAALLAAVMRERRRRRTLVNLLRWETIGLCREAAELAEAICERTRGGVIDQAFLGRYALTEPQTYRGLVPSLWRLPDGLAWRAVELHGHLSLARTRFAAWRDGERSEISTYLLLSALTRSANGGDGLVRDSAPHPGLRDGWKPHMPLASAYLEGMEQEDLDLLDFGYWSCPV